MDKAAVPLGAMGSTVKVKRATPARPQQDQADKPTEDGQQRRVSIQDSAEPPPQRSGSISRRARGQSISQRVQRSFDSSTTNPPTRPRGLTALPTIPSQKGLDFPTAQRANDQAADTQEAPPRTSISRASVDSGPVAPPQTVRVRVGSLRGRKSSETGRRPSLSSAGPAQDAEATTTTRPRAYTVGGTLGRLRGATLGSVKERPAVDDDADHHEAHEVDLLEVVDPAVATAATLSQIQSAIFLPPNLGISYRRPVVDLAASPASIAARRRATTVSRPATGPAAAVPSTDGPEADEAELETVTEEEMLDEHLKELVRAKGKKRQTIERAWHGFLAFAKTPLGFCVCIYGFFVVFWGAALVLILIHAITFSSYHLYQKWVEICSQILNGLFTVPGIGLFPGRLWDWWNAGIILHYAKLTYRRRAKRHLDPLPDPNDLPDPDSDPASGATVDKAPSSAGAADDDDVEKGPSKPAFPGEGEGHVEHGPLEGCTVVLGEKELARLRKAQSRLSKSQTWYRPHATHTHRAFPIKWMVVILSLNVSNSVWQACLCGVMWGLRYYNRPGWTTAVFIVFSFLSGIAAGVFIWQIGKRTRKTPEVLKHVEDAIAADEKNIVEAVESGKDEGQERVEKA